jgi:hypothetical protein
MRRTYSLKNKKYFIIYLTSKEEEAKKKLEEENKLLEEQTAGSQEETKNAKPRTKYSAGKFPHVPNKGKIIKARESTGVITQGKEPVKNFSKM